MSIDDPLDFLADEFPCVSTRIRIENVKREVEGQDWPDDEWLVRIDSFDGECVVQCSSLREALTTALTQARLLPTPAGR